MTRPAGDTEESVAHLWLDVLRIFLVSLPITILLPFIWSYARPLKNLAKAAEAVRKGKANGCYSGFKRRDEIGDLPRYTYWLTRALTVWIRLTGSQPMLRMN